MNTILALKKLIVYEKYQATKLIYTGGN